MRKREEYGRQLLFLTCRKVSLSELLLISVWRKFFVVRRGKELVVVLVLDAAPIPFSFRCYLCPIMQYSICISAVHAVYFLRGIEVRQLVAVNFDVLFSADIRDAVEREADPMVYLYPHIHDYNGNN